LPHGGATSPDQAIPRAKVVTRRSWIFDQMVARGVFVRVGHDYYFMNERAARAFLAAQRRRALIVTAVLLLLCLVLQLISRTR
jgi:hypothetical protein